LSWEYRNVISDTSLSFRFLILIYLLFLNLYHILFKKANLHYCFLGGVTPQSLYLCGFAGIF
jgi:hypothetical protein